MYEAIEDGDQKYRDSKEFNEKFYQKSSQN